MGIIYDKNKKTFTLETKASSYQMQVDRYGFLLHLYYGKRIRGCMDYLLTFYDRGFSGNPYDAGNDRTYSMDAQPQEFPCQGNGDYRAPALILKSAEGICGCDLRYQGHRILKGKYGLSGLPAVYADENESETLEILLEDSTAQVEVKLLYGVLPQLDIITRSAVVKNCRPAGDANTRLQSIYLEKVHSACLDFLTEDYDFISFYGRHAMERNFQRVPVAHGRLGKLLFHVLCVQRRI